MKNINWKAAIVTMATAAFCGASGYISGHATCAHQHVDPEEQARMLPDVSFKGQIQYVKNAFKDYKKMKEDPYGLK